MDLDHLSEKFLLALVGIAGVILGVVLTSLKELVFNCHKRKKDAEYLGVRVSSLLDRFVWGCVDVIYDDGTDRGQLSDNEYAYPQVETPSFQPELLQVEWKSIPAQVMAEVLNFPNLISRADRRIGDAFENANPPDFDDGYAQRQYDYALLGIEAARIANILRSLVKITILVEDQADSLQRLSVAKQEYEKRKAERERLHRETWPGLPQA
jgi:hypothetical protein